MSDEHLPDAPRPPLLRIVRGDPSPQELAALTVVVASLAADRPPGRRVTPSVWSDPRRRVRAPMAGSWRASALPR